MIYLQYCCLCVDLRMGTVIIGVLELLCDIVFGIFIALFGESGIPDLCHKLFLIFIILHLISTVLLIFGAIMIRPGYMLLYIILSMIRMVLVIILLISDIILNIWYVILILYAVWFVLGTYFWLVAYSFYAAIGGSIFI